MSDVGDKAAFIWVSAVFSPDWTHEWYLLITHAIECYLRLLSPVSARERKSVAGTRRRKGDKNHLFLLLWPHACTPV